MGKGSWELLLAVEHEEGVAGMFRDREDGSFWLSGTVEHGGSGMTERRFTFEGLRDAWVQGGFLPPDATRVLARDAHGGWSEGIVGNGVWLAIARAHPLAVRFEDAPVHPGEDEDRAVVCRRCGHQVTMGVWYAGAGDVMDPQPAHDRWRERADAMRHVFAAARFPVYGLAAWEGERRWAGHGEGVRGVDHIVLDYDGRGALSSRRAPTTRRVRSGGSSERSNSSRPRRSPTKRGSASPPRR